LLQIHLDHILPHLPYTPLLRSSHCRRDCASNLSRSLLTEKSVVCLKSACCNQTLRLLARIIRAERDRRRITRYGVLNVAAAAPRATMTSIRKIRFVELASAGFG